MRKISIDEFKNFTYPSNLTYKDGRVFFTETRVNMDENTYEKYISYINLENKEKISLTTSGKEGSFKFLKDGRVIFPSTRDRKKDDKKTYFYTIDPRGGERKEFFNTEIQVQDFEVLSEDKILLLGGEITESNEFEEIEVLPFWFNGQGFIQNNKTKLYIYDLNEKKEEEILGSDIRISSIKLNEDKTKILVIYQDNTKLMQLKEKLGIFDLKTLNLQLINQGMAYYYGDFTSKGIIFLGSKMENHGLNEDPKVYLYDYGLKETMEISREDFDLDFSNTTGTDLRQGGGKSFMVYEDELYFIQTKNNHSILSKIDLSGNVSDLITRDGSVEAFDMDRENGQIHLIAMRDLLLPEIYILEGKEEIKISDYSKDLKDINLSPIEEFDFTNDGIDFKGYVIKPVDYEEGKKYPGILEIHGGPKTVFSNIIHHEMQYLASLGYFVFYTNPRGSSSRGVAFSDIRGKYGSIDYDDLMTFTDEVLKRYEDIDKENLAVMGGSYGGFMTNWIIGHTDRFKVANSQRSISNWTSFYGVSDIGYYFQPDQTGRNHYDDLDKVWDQSPLKYGRNVKTPTLFIHADQDYRCPLEQGIQMYQALKTNGVDSRLVIFHGENHELSRSGKPKGRVKRLEEIVNFYDKHIEK